MFWKHRTADRDDQRGFQNFSRELPSDSMSGHPSRRTRKSIEQEDLEDAIKHQDDPIEEDTYGYVIASLVRDIGWLQKGTKLKMLRIFRLISAVLLLGVTIGLQMLIIFFVRQLLTATSVHEIRVIYSEYERLMYPNHTSLIYHVGGLVYYRGTDKAYRVAKNFALLNEDQKDALCSIPLSQPLYLGTILLIWSLTCAYQLRSNYEKFNRLVLKIDTVSTMEASTEPKAEDPTVVIVKGLTRNVKLALVLIVFVPQTLMTVLLCWLGCQWLTATPDLEELVLNAVALEFVLLLKDVLYKVLVPRRSKLETQSTFIVAVEDGEGKRPVSMGSLFQSFGWGIAAVAWVLVYVLTCQRVLVDYKWDIADICLPYLAAKRKV